ncbi:hypothetical protein BN979_03783 [Mycolicibacterium vulneris]|nr:hypothetical protein BN979_03783 [Mycolicibacterium vulneris]
MPLRSPAAVMQVTPNTKGGLDGRQTYTGT